MTTGAAALPTFMPGPQTLHGGYPGLGGMVAVDVAMKREAMTSLNMMASLNIVH